MQSLQEKPSILIFHGDKQVAVCTAKSVGMLGLQVTMDEVCFPRYTNIEIEVIDTRQNIHTHRLPAVVTSCSSQGMGLTLKGTDSRVLEEWRTMLLGLVRNDVH